ncbi:hypothetical protein LIER_10248 [Lithospermum erythrorhizon]|uniref:Uncharacterized protein n=1 Tax=Lithospermum erythrorhizon TaxID=34254 RepID=A0AAV3PII3_LITER
MLQLARELRRLEELQIAGSVEDAGAAEDLVRGEEFAGEEEVSSDLWEKLAWGCSRSVSELLRTSSEVRSLPEFRRRRRLPELL